MNKQEAIDLLEDISQVNGAVFEVSKDLAGASKTAISALEKQIPKKVLNRQELKDFHGRIYTVKGDCPQCKTKRLLSAETDYCNCCGQKLDWRLLETSTIRRTNEQTQHKNSLRS